jgi:hypothetical protein
MVHVRFTGLNFKAKHVEKTSLLPCEAPEYMFPLHRYDPQSC